MRRHVGRHEAEVARWQGLHEDLHAAMQVCAELARKLHVATQVPAQLVGLAAVCERRRSLGWRGPGSGPADTFGKGLAGGTCFVPLLFVVLALALLWLSWAPVLPWLTSPVLLGVTVGAAPTARAQVKGYRRPPSFVHQQEPPVLGHT